MPRVNVIIEVMNDEGEPFWLYNHSEQVYHSTSDPQANLQQIAAKTQAVLTEAHESISGQIAAFAENTGDGGD